MNERRGGGSGGQSSGRAFQGSFLSLSFLGMSESCS